MDPVKVFDNVGPGQNYFFTPKFLNLDYLFYKIYEFFTGANRGGVSTDTGVNTEATTDGFLKIGNFSLWGDILKNLLYLLIIFFLTVIAYITVRMLEIRKKEKEYMKQKIAEYAKKHEEKEKEVVAKEQISRNPRWIAVLEYLSSGAQSDWKLSVLEADSMLDDLMDDLKFRGENLGEKLKNADREKFPNLTLAWEVHIIRNKIAHEGATYDLSLREAKRIIAIYEQIFRDFGYI